VSKRVARTLDIRIVDHLPIDPKTGMGRKVCRRMLSANIEDIRLPSNRQMQHVGFEVKMALSRSNQRSRRRRRAR